MSIPLYARLSNSRHSYCKPGIRSLLCYYQEKEHCLLAKTSSGPPEASEGLPETSGGPPKASGGLAEASGGLAEPFHNLVDFMPQLKPLEPG